LERIDSLTIVLLACALLASCYASENIRGQDGSGADAPELWDTAPDPGAADTLTEEPDAAEDPPHEPFEDDVCLEAHSVVRLSAPGDKSEEAALAWTGSKFGVTWTDRRDLSPDLYFTLVSTGGGVGDEVRLTDSHGDSLHAALVWSGSEYAVAWVDMRLMTGSGIYFARLNVEGRSVGDDVPVSIRDSPHYAPGIAWSGSEYGVAWTEGNLFSTDVVFARVSGAGSLVGESVKLMSSDYWEGAACLPRVVWTGSGYFTAWFHGRDYAVYGDGGELHVAGIDAGGEVSTELRVLSDIHTGSMHIPALAWSGSEFGVAWMDEAGCIQFVRLGAGVVPLHEHRELGCLAVQDIAGPGHTRVVDMVWTGAMYAVTWSSMEEDLCDVRLAVLDSGGMRLGGTFTVTDHTSHSVAPQLAWTGSEFGIAWQDDRTGCWEIMLARVAQCP
jgi:hypothetical protein